MNEEHTTYETVETETPSTPPAPEPGSNEYNARLAAEGSVALGQVPDKFKNEDGTVNMEAFTKSYMELREQAPFSAPEEPVTPQPEEETTPRCCCRGTPCTGSSGRDN